MLLDELAVYAATLGLTYPIKKGWLPKGVDAAVCIREAGGTGDELGFGVAGIQFEHPVVHVEVRGVAEDYAGPRSELEKIYQGFPKIQAQTLNSTGYYHTVIPRQSPFLAHIDEKRRPVLAVVFDVTKKPSTA